MPSWTPDLLGAANLKFWLKADAITDKSDGDTVTTWSGSINNKNAVASAGEEPTYETNEVNGLPILRFPGTDEDMSITGHGLTKPCTVAFVCKMTAGASSGRIVSCTNMLITRGGSGNNDFLMNGGSALQYSTDTLDANYHVHVLSFASSSTSRGSFDGTATTGNAGTGSLSANMIIGSGGAANYVGMDLLEILGVNGALETLNLQRLEGYLAHRAGLSANLPSSHPYRYFAPRTDSPLALGNQRGLRYTLSTTYRPLGYLG